MFHAYVLLLARPVMPPSASFAAPAAPSSMPPPTAAAVLGTDMMDLRTERLHALARRAVHRGDLETASRCYEICLRDPHSAHPRSFLLAGLHHLRCNRWQMARECFRAGNRAHRDNPKLLQAWGLLESRQGNMRVACQLLKQCVRVDSTGTHEPVMRWQRFASVLAN